MAKQTAIPDVTLELVKTILDAAAIENEIDEDNEIYVRDDNFPFWIALDAERNFLFLYTYMRAENMTHDEGTTRANELNSSVILTCFWHENERLAGTMPFTSGKD